MERSYQLPLSLEERKEIRSGDYVLLSGIVYTARDAAHQRMWEALEKGEPLPIDIKEQCIYYLGPSPSRPGNVIGSAGPTTSSRMDKYTPLLLDAGLALMIGKGKRNKEVKESICKNNSIYFAAVGGAGALLSQCIKSAKIVAYEDLGTEAIRKLEVVNLPVIAIIDTTGNDLYERGNQ